MFMVLLTLIFIRPFISSAAFPALNFIYCVLIIGLLAVPTFSRKISVKKLGGLKIPLALFLFALAASVLISRDKLTSIHELLKYLAAIFLFVHTASLTDSDKKKRIINLLVLSGLMVSLLAVYQFFFGFRHIAQYLSQNNISYPFALDYIRQKRVFSPFVTPNILAGYLAMIMPLTLINKKRTWVIAPMLLAFLLTKSLGASISVFLVLAVYFCLEGKFRKQAIVILIALLLSIIIAFGTRTLVQQEHMQPLFSTLMRIYYWKGTWSIIKAQPVLGIGLGMLRKFSLLDSRYTHNSYLQIWAEMGILGIGSWLWLVIAVMREGLRKIKSPACGDKRLNAALLVAAGVFLVHNLVDFSFFLPEASMLWWIIAGLLSSKENSAPLIT